MKVRTSLDWLAFLSSALWPITVLVLVLIFRKSISGLLKGIKDFKLPGGVEATFDNDIRRIEDKAEAVEIESASRAAVEASATATDPVAPAEDDDREHEKDSARAASTAGTPQLDEPQFSPYRFLEDGIFSSAHPVGMTLLSWSRLEEEIIFFYTRAASGGCIDDSNERKGRLSSSVNQLVRRLHEAGLLEVREVDLIDDLRNTRNKVAHSSDVRITEGQSLSYAEAVGATIGLLRAKARRLPER